MLSLDSPDWKRVDTYAGSGEELPRRFVAWRDAVGTPDEEGEWGWLRDQFLCQHTIKDSAIAIVPHICEAVLKSAEESGSDYAIDLGQVHMAWRRSPIQNISVEIVRSYEAAIVSIRPWACACLTRPLERMQFRYVLSACCALCDHTGLGSYLFSLDHSPSEFPDLGGYV
jgi:hypothetical protein